MVLEATSWASTSASVTASSSPPSLVTLLSPPPGSMVSRVTCRVSHVAWSVSRPGLRVKHRGGGARGAAAAHLCIFFRGRDWRTLGALHRHSALRRRCVTTPRLMRTRERKICSKWWIPVTFSHDPTDILVEMLTQTGWVMNDIFSKRQQIMYVSTILNVYN